MKVMIDYKKRCGYDGFYFIISGKVQIISTMTREIFTEISRGDYFGEAQLLKHPVS